MRSRRVPLPPATQIREGRISSHNLMSWVLIWDEAVPPAGTGRFPVKRHDHCYLCGIEDAHLAIVDMELACTSSRSLAAG